MAKQCLVFSRSKFEPVEQADNTLSNVRYTLQLEKPQSAHMIADWPQVLAAIQAIQEENMTDSMMQYPLTLSHILERAGKVFPDREVVSRLPDHSLHRYTWGDVHRRARALAEALQKAGLGPGEIGRAHV